jgi:uncharacterized protein
MRVLLCWLVSLMFSFAATAQDLPQPLSDTVSDFAHVLPAADMAKISAALVADRAETGVHMVVVTMPSVMGAKPEEQIEAYAKRLFNAWGIGDAGRNDGIMILVVPGDRVVRIALGAGYDSIYDGRAQRVIETAMLPAFRDNRIADGIVAGVESARQRLIDPFVAGKPITVDEGFPAQSGGLVTWVGGALALVGLGGWGGRKIWIARKTCPKCGELTLTRHSEVLHAATFSMAGDGVTHLRCARCDYTEDRPYRIAPRSERNRAGRNRSGGGGGGFGGGRSSGGGATGRW